MQNKLIFNALLEQSQETDKWKPDFQSLEMI
jgi:hypothetical protein